MTRAEKAERRTQIREDYISGSSTAEIAKRHGITEQYVYQVCSGLPKRKRGGVLSNNKEEVIKMRLSGVSTKEIAEKYGVSNDVARSFLYANGVTLNKPNDDEEVARKISEKTNGLVEYVSGYTKKENPIIVRCTVCGGEFTRTFHSLTCNKYIGCPVCKQRRNDSIKAKREKQRQERRRIAEERKAEAKAKHEAWISRPYHKCAVCGTLTQNPKYCCEECRKKANNKMNEHRRRNILKNQLIDKDITVEGLFKRDKGICYLCGGKCDYEDYTVRDGAFIAGDWYPSIDHIKPISKGGLHSWDNVQLAHRRCNWEKSDKIIG